MDPQSDRGGTRRAWYDINHGYLIVCLAMGSNFFLCSVNDEDDGSVLLEIVEVVSGIIGIGFASILAEIVAELEVGFLVLEGPDDNALLIKRNENIVCDMVPFMYDNCESV